MLKKVLLANEYHLGTKSETFQHLLSHEILPYPPSLAEIKDEIGGYRLRGGNKSALIDCMKTKLSIQMWPKQMDSSEENLATGYVIDIMGFIRTKMPQVGECVKSFAE